MATESRDDAPPPLAFGINSYRRVPDPDELDLRWSPDEFDFVRPAHDQAWQRVAAAAVERSRRYAVTDPFGGELAHLAVSHHFTRRLAPGMITFGAGVTGLLHDLAAIAAGRTVAVGRYGHPDLPSWAQQHEATVVAPDDVATADVVLLDSPDLSGRTVEPDEVRRHAAAAGLCVVDESQANYFGPAASLVRMVGDVPNLMVLRGLAKGYCCGGLRVGYAVAAAGPTSRFRRYATPLATSALALDVAVALLEQGDVFAELRRRIRAAKPAAVDGLRRLGLPVLPGHPDLPWLIVPWSAPAVRLLRGHRLLGKELTLSGHSMIKLAVPLSDDRRRRFARAVAG
jgi:histidinol-phosphate/aromatic aminotransferase/cobyric acid decarboxylase-like protein